MTTRKIKVLIVDDSLLFRETMARELTRDPALEVVGTASDPYMARDKILQYEPDVMTLDVEMPRMNGIEFLRRLMPQYPLPVVMLSALSETVFEALEAGAVDFVAKPELRKGDNLDSFVKELILKIKIASVARVGHQKKPSAGDLQAFKLNRDVRGMVIAIGASTGGTEAIYQVLKDCPPEIPGIVIVQHMPAGFTAMYAKRLNHSCAIEVKEAQNGDQVKPGRALIAPGDYHMRLQKTGSIYTVECFQGEKVNGHCPSVDVLFHSVARHAGSKAIGIILTGMGSDGAQGLLAMRQAGARTIGQDQETSVVYGMPRAAHELGAVQHQLPLNRIILDGVRL